MKCPMEKWTKSTFLATFFSEIYYFCDLVHFSFVPFLYRRKSVRLLLSVCRLSSVTLLRRTQTVKRFGSILHHLID